MVTRLLIMLTVNRFFFAEEKVMYLKPDQEKNKSHFIDPKVR